MKAVFCRSVKENRLFPFKELGLLRSFQFSDIWINQIQSRDTGDIIMHIFLARNLKLWYELSEITLTGRSATDMHSVYLSDAQFTSKSGKAIWFLTDQGIDIMTKEWVEEPLFWMKSYDDLSWLSLFSSWPNFFILLTCESDYKLNKEKSNSSLSMEDGQLFSPLEETAPER